MMSRKVCTAVLSKTPSQAVRLIRLLKGEPLYT